MNFPLRDVVRVTQLHPLKGHRSKVSDARIRNRKYAIANRGGSMGGQGRGRPPSEISAPPPVAPKKFKIRPSLAKIFRKLALH